MSSIIDLYKGSEYENVGSSNVDKTPFSDDASFAFNGKINDLDQARGGAVPDTKKYSDTVNYGN